MTTISAVNFLTETGSAAFNAGRRALLTHYWPSEASNDRGVWNARFNAMLPPALQIAADQRPAQFRPAYDLLNRPRSLVQTALFGAGEPGTFLWIGAAETQCWVQRSSPTTPAQPGDPVGTIVDTVRNVTFVAPTDAARAVLRREPVSGVRNLLRQTENLETSDWVKEGGTTATGRNVTFVGTAGSISSANARLLQQVTVGPRIGRTFTVRFVVPAAAQWSDPTAVLRFLGLGFTAIQTITAPAQATAFSFTGTASTAGNDLFFLMSADKNVTISNLGEFQLEESATPTAYQRVTNANDITEAGVRESWFLRADGVDDGYQTTANLSMGTANEVYIGYAGRRRQSTTAGIVAEVSPDANANANAFFFTAPLNATFRYGFMARGSLGALPSNILAPAPAGEDLAVVDAFGSIPGDLSRMWRNGVVGTDVTSDRGTGNFTSAHRLNLLARNNAAATFSAVDLSALIIRGGALTPAQQEASRRALAAKIGVQFNV